MIDLTQRLTITNPVRSNYEAVLEIGVSLDAIITGDTYSISLSPTKNADEFIIPSAESAPESLGAMPKVAQ